MSDIPVQIDGREVMIAEKDGQEILLGEKMPPAVIPESWMRRVGRYQLLNPDEESPVTAPSIWFKHGTLGMSYRMPLISEKLVRMPVRPISDTEAVILPTFAVVATIGSLWASRWVFQPP